VGYKVLNNMESIVSDISYVSLALSLLCHLGFLVSVSYAIFSFFWYKDKAYMAKQVFLFFCMCHS